MYNISKLRDKIKNKGEIRMEKSLIRENIKVRLVLKHYQSYIREETEEEVIDFVRSQVEEIKNFKQEYELKINIDKFIYIRDYSERCYGSRDRVTEFILEFSCDNWVTEDKENEDYDYELEFQEYLMDLGIYDIDYKVGKIYDGDYYLEWKYI